MRLVFIFVGILFFSGTTLFAQEKLTPVRLSENGIRAEIRILKSKISARDSKYQISYLPTPMEMNPQHYSVAFRSSVTNQIVAVIIGNLPDSSGRLSSLTILVDPLANDIATTQRRRFNILMEVANSPEFNLALAASRKKLLVPKGDFFTQGFMNLLLKHMAYTKIYHTTTPSANAPYTVILADNHVISNERLKKPDLVSTEIKTEELIEQRLKAELRYEDILLNATHLEVAAFTQSHIPFCQQIFAGR